MIVLSLGERDPEAVRACLASPPPGAGAIEVRLDLLRGRDPRRWLSVPRDAAVPVIATCRPARQGGAFRGGEAARIRVLAGAARAGADYVDVEWGSAAARDLSVFAPAKVILSRHFRRATPPLRALAAAERAMSAKRGVAVVKIVCHAAHPSDMLRIRTFLGKTSGRRAPLAAFCMGEIGTASRILAPSWGSWATYACADGAKRTAPGQVTLAEAVEVYRVEAITPATHLTGITGYPVSHSLSPLIHNAAFARDRIDFRYLPFPARKPGDLSKLIRELPIRGLSVTAPHKISMLKLIRDSESEARAVGAVNTVLSSAGGLLGFNTDAEGILAALARVCDPRGRRALIVGAGGAARAAAFALARAGAKVLVASRRAARAAGLARSAGATHVPLAGIARQDYEILVNATPVGSEGRGMPVPLAAVRGRAIVDLVYAPGGTPLIRAARLREIPAVDGHEVLLEQAAAQYTMFTGRNAPAEAMRAALRKHLLRASAGTR